MAEPLPLPEPVGGPIFGERWDVPAAPKTEPAEILRWLQGDLGVRMTTTLVHALRRRVGLCRTAVPVPARRDRLADLGLSAEQLAHVAAAVDRRFGVRLAFDPFTTTVADLAEAIAGAIQGGHPAC